jgi:2-hydroxy-6-oxonona-2,4-dienedioate hydrolase
MRVIPSKPGLIIVIFPQQVQAPGDRLARRRAGERPADGGPNVTTDGAPGLAVRRSGSGPDLVLFHGGMGSWKHWVRNIEPLATRFTVHALDHPSYGASAPVPRETTGAAYLDLVHGLFRTMFPGEAPLRLAGFSFGGAIATNLARRLAPRVTHLCLVSPGGFPSRRFGDRPTRSYKEAGNDERLFREICRHNLLVNMLSDPKSVTDESVDIQADGVRRTRFNSRKVSGGGTLLGDLAQLRGSGCRIRLLWGERDDSEFRPAALLIGEIREAVGTLDVHRIPAAGHWSAYENAPAVNHLMLEFFSS